jgi:hypothetical protein
MRIRTIRSLATATLLTAGLAAFPGCNAENPDGTKTNLGKAEDAAKNLEHKVVEGAKEAGKEIKEGTIKAVDATGKAIEHTGEKLEAEGKESAEKHLGKTAGSVVEGTGKALDKTGEKIQDAVKPKD